MTLQNEKFEELVSRQLTAELEPQRGKALAAFRAQMAAPPAPIPIPFLRSRKNLALWAGVPSLLAACVAVVVTLHFAGNHKPIIETNIVVTTTTAPAELAKGDAPPVTTLPKNTGTIVFDGIVTRDTPGNIIMGRDNTPVREVNHLEIRQLKIVDPSDHSTMTITEPVERKGYVPVQPY